MPKQAGKLFIVMGAVLITTALLLFFHNQYIAYSAGKNAEILLESVCGAIENGKEGNDNLSDYLPVVEIEGYGYVGYLSVPDLELNLPVMSEWDYTRLKIAPCRQFGSSRTDDLVIAAHNYKKHFGKLSQLEIGAKITFTDMDGIEKEYVLQNISTLQAEDVDIVQNSGYDLVLYTCTPGGNARVTVFCNRLYK